MVKRTRASHKNVTYELRPGEEIAWHLATAGTDNPAVSDRMQEFAVDMILDAVDVIGDKAKRLDVALAYIFERFFDIESRQTPARIIMVHADWTQQIINQSTRQYGVFLERVRRLLERQPDRVRRAYLQGLGQREPLGDDLFARCLQESRAIKRVVELTYPQLSKGITVRRLSVELQKRYHD